MNFLVLVDASVLIPLARTGKLWFLKKLFKKVNITAGVKKEIELTGKTGGTEIEKALQTWINEIKEGSLFQESKNLAEKENISFADAELILTALKTKQEILSNDYRIHAVAKTKQVQTEWLTSILLLCVRKKILTKTQAKETLFELVQAGMWLKVDVYAIAEKKIDEL